MIHSAPYPTNGQHNCESVYVLQRLLRLIWELDPTVCQHPQIAPYWEWTTDDPHTREVFVKARLGSQQVRRICALAWEQTKPLVRQIFVLQTMMSGQVYLSEAFRNLQQLLVAPADAPALEDLDYVVTALYEQIMHIMRRVAGVPVAATAGDITPAPGPARRAIRLFEDPDARNPRGQLLPPTEGET